MIGVQPLQALSVDQEDAFQSAVLSHQVLCWRHFFFGLCLVLLRIALLPLGRDGGPRKHGNHKPASRGRARQKELAPRLDSHWNAPLPMQLNRTRILPLTWDIFTPVSSSPCGQYILAL